MALISANLRKICVNLGEFSYTFIMAKGNLFLGMGRGSVGDVTFYRADGQQLSRARNRKPRNPKSNAQLIQRAISATIVQAYKAGSVIFDHSFEGKSVPAGSQRAFLSTNMRKLREQVLSEMDLQAADQYSSVVSPRSVYPVPNAYRISEGSLIQNVFVQGTGIGDKIAAVPVAALQGETIAAYLTRLNITPGEIFTVVSFGVVTNSGERESLISPQCTFGFMRLTVKTAAASSTKTMATATFQDIFDIDSAGAVLPTSRLFTDGISVDDLDITGTSVGGIGVIRSNENSGLRSSSDLWVPNGDDNTPGWGVRPGNLLAAWSQDSGSVDSELILEGGAI